MEELNSSVVIALTIGGVDN